LRDLIRFDWNAMDGWFEEDEEVFVHPHDPYTRIDILHSSRPVEVNGAKVADRQRHTLLFETRLPARYYVPKVDVRMDLLTPTDTVTGCAYKGFAQCWSVDAGGETVKDLAWSYKTPLPENIKIAGLVAFYNERTDITLDGERQTRPKTKFSRVTFEAPTTLAPGLWQAPGNQGGAFDSLARAALFSESK